MPATRTVRLILGGLLASLYGGGTCAAEPSGEGVQFFEKRVRPVLVEHCYGCHSAKAEKLRGGLLLDSREGVLKGGDTGPAVVPGEPDKSLLIKAVRHADDDLKMPPKAKLPAAVIADLEAWVKMGAPDPRSKETAVAPRKTGINVAEARKFWSLRPVADPPVPALKDRGRARNAIDHFILARLEARGLRPVPEADKRTLIRRVTFDVTGLPPTPDEVDGFLGDTSPDAYEKLIDRLLASPAYGERWGRHWLDVVRYADTSGCNSDFPVPSAYRYRNYVLAAFNKDKPYDQFVREQIAGDLLPYDTPAQRHEQIIATGYLALSRRFGSLDDENHLTIEDTIDTLGKSFLGLTLGCARCHDHKFDPLTHEDYYGLYGILAGTRYAFPGTEIYRWPRDLVPLVASPQEEDALRPHLDKMAAMDQEYRRLWLAWLHTDTGPDREKAKAAFEAVGKQRDEFVKQSPAYDKAYAVLDGQGSNAHVHVKGDPEKLGPEVPRRFLEVLGGQEVPRDETGSGRRQLADWLADSKNPLTARVLVNRVWLHHFGRGLVGTPNDFGARGKPPTHPELLDWLAARFVADGWSVKALHRRILLSAAYSTGSSDDARLAAADPDNELYGRFPHRRLDAEEIRDAMLAVSGGLDRTPGGPHPFPPEAEWRFTQHKPFYAVYDTDRRSVYLMQQRLKRHPYLEAFDGADPNATTAQRGVSTTPVQALFLMNNPFVHAQAARFADRVVAADGGTGERIDLAYRLAFARPPLREEFEAGQDYLRRCEEKLAEASIPTEQRAKAAWASYLRVLYSSNEFVFVD